MITRESRNILIADDSMFFRAKLKDIMEECGHRVRFAKGGKDAVAAIQAGPGEIDLLTLDLEMADFSGLDVLNWIGVNGLGGKFPVLVITSKLGDEALLSHLRCLGATEFLHKGFTPQQLLLQVNKLIFRDKWQKGVKRDRAPVSITADFSYGDRIYAGFLLNIGKRGAYLNATKCEFAKGTTIKLRFTLPGAAREFNVEAAVRWTSAELGLKTEFAGAGVMFKTLSAEDSQLLAVFIASEAKRLAVDGVMGKG